MNTFMFVDSSAQTLPLVYSVENTSAGYPKPTMPSVSELPTITALPDPFEWADGRGRITNFSDWRYRRAEIKAMFENYEIGTKPDRPDNIQASFSHSDSVLTVRVTVNAQTLTLTTKVILPAGSGPFPAVIGMDFITADVFSSRNIAQLTFHSSQVTTYGGPKMSDPYYQLYPALNPANTGQYRYMGLGSQPNY